MSDFQYLKSSERILSLKNKTLSSERFLSVEQAIIITKVYQQNSDIPIILKRSIALAESLLQMPIAIDPEELVVGNRTPDIRAGVALLIAALSAEGKSIIHNIEQIDRGYQNIDMRLNALGANIQRVE